MKNKVIKKVLALSLVACLVIPVLSYAGPVTEAKAADTEWDAEVGDTNADETINAVDLVILKKNVGEGVAEQYDVNNDTLGNGTDADLMRQFLIGKISSFYRPDISAINNDTLTYQVTDDLDREMTDASASNGKAVGVRYFLHHGVEKNNMAELHFYHFSDAAGGVNIVTKSAYQGGSTISFKAKLPTTQSWWGISFGTANNFDIYGAAGTANGIPASTMTKTDEGDGWYRYEGTLPSGGPYYFGISGAKSWSEWGNGSLVVDDFVITKPDGTIVEDGFEAGLSGGIFNVTEIGEVGNSCTCEVHTAVELISETVDSSESSTIYDVSAVIEKNSNAAVSDSAWLAAGGGPVGAAHWWGEPLFGFYGAMDKWIIERDVQMLTDAGVDYLAIDTDEGVLESRLKLLLETLDKFQDQGFNVPKVTFTTAVDDALLELVNSYGLLYADTIDELNATTVRLAKSLGDYPMSASAFYGNMVNQQRNYNGKKHDASSKTADYEGALLEWEFEKAIESDAKNVLVESWNEWISERQAGTTSEPIVLKENANIANSSDIQPMKDGYGDDYYMQFIDCVKRFKGNSITNNNLNTVDSTESIVIDVNKDFQQWNKVNTHYLDYTNEEATPTEDTRTTTKQEAEIKFGVNGTYIITKDAYAAGSTVSFKITIPEDLVVRGDNQYPWWDIYAVSDKASVDIYTHSLRGLVQVQANQVGAEIDVNVTLPSTSDEYYIYIAGEWNQWKNASGDFVTIEIADFKITSGDTTVSDGEIFEAVGSGATLHSVTKVLTNEVIDYAAALDIDRFDGTGANNIITKEAYAGGSKITFEAFTPENVGWWGINYTSDNSSTSNYENWLNDPWGDPPVKGDWKEYSFVLPEGGPYYIYFSGAISEWNGQTLLIDNFTVTNSAGTLASEDFDSGLNRVFTTGTSVSLAERSRKEVPLPETNDIDKMKMTSDGEYLYALVETVDNIAAFGDESNRMSLFISTGNVGGCWNQYEYVINRDSTKATASTVTIERYAGGAWKQVTDTDGNAVTAKYRIEGNMMQLAIPLSALGCTEAFDMEFKWADNYDEDDIYSFYTQGDAAPYGRSNYVYSVVPGVVSLSIEKINDVDFNSELPVSFITKKKYPAGSKVSFEYYISAEGTVTNGDGTGDTWWNLYYTADLEELSNYSADNAQGLPKEQGEWKQTEEFTIPGEGEYYIYLAGPPGEWPDTPVLIDNFTIKDEAGNVIEKETFNAGYGIFNADGSAVEWKNTSTLDNSNQAAQLNIYDWDVNAGGSNFVTKDAYTGGTIEFDYFITTALANTEWWKYALTTAPDTYDVYTQGTNMDKTAGTWVHKSIPIPSDGTYTFLFAGPQGELNNNPFYVDNFKVYDEAGNLIAKDDFRNGLHNGMFEIKEQTTGREGKAVSLGMPDVGEETVTYGEYYVSLDHTADTVKFISEVAYPGNSTISFDAFVPIGTPWWRVAWTTDKTSPDWYNDAHVVMSDKGDYEGGWSNYTVTLPDGGPYYIHFPTEIGKTPSPLLIDNVEIKYGDETLVYEDFNCSSIDESVFDIVKTGNVKLVLDESEADIQFTAYDAPTINGQVSGDATATVDAAYKALADAGFTKALALREGYTTVAQAQSETGSTAFADYVKWRTEKYDSAATVALDIAAQHGLSYYTKDWSFYNLGKTSTDESVIDSTKISAESDFKTVINTVINNSTFLTHPAYVGHYASDEPADSTTDFNALKYQAKYYNQIMQEKGLEGELYVNLNPAYGPQDDRTWWDKLVGNEADKYNTDYVNSYVKKYLDVATASDSKINYISWDYYPFMLDSDDDKQLREENYLYNFKVMADAAKNNNLGLRYTLQSTGEQDYGLRDITSAADFRFQIYTGMAFGVNDFTYYKYGGTNGEGIFDYMTGETNQTVYGYAKKVNNEVHAIENFFADYKWDSIMAKQGTNTTTMSDRMIDGVQLSNSNSISHGKINSVTATQDTICGIFNAVDAAAKSSRPYGYMFVNIADPTNNATDTVTVNFADGVKAVCICINGKQSIESVSNNTYTFTLEAGAGAFIVPILN